MLETRELCSGSILGQVVVRSGTKSMDSGVSGAVAHAERKLRAFLLVSHLEKLLAELVVKRNPNEDARLRLCAASNTGRTPQRPRPLLAALSHPHKRCE